MTARSRRPCARPSRPRVALELTDRGRPRTDPALLRRVVRAVATFAGRDLQVSLLLTGDREIAALHAEHLGDATPTDVMSFLVDGTAEVVVSVTTAARVARMHGHTRAAEVALYVVHGLLHTLGFDDTTPRARARMRAAERAILRRLRLVVAAVDDDAR